MASDNLHLTRCNSFVFFDLETTGLIGREEDGGKTKVTEMCFIGLSRENFTKVRHELPRVIHKLSVPVNPMKVIPDITFKLTGLSNEQLHKESSFDEKKASLIGFFLRQLPQPVCLVAHNGSRFDFPLLKEELLNFKDIIPEHTRCVDTIHSFRDLYNQPDVDDSFKFNFFTKEIDEELMEAADKCEREYVKSIGDVTMGENDMNLTQMVNETTPISQKIVREKDVNTTKRKLFVDDGALRTTIWSRPSPTPVFSLRNVHVGLFGKEPESAHRAEDDVLSMIRCCSRCGPRILEHFDRNSQLFSNVRRIYFD